MIEAAKLLKEIRAQLVAGQTAQPTTIREFLWWFGFQRRTNHNVQVIDGELQKLGMQTVPNYLNRWVDTPITFELVRPKPDSAKGRKAAETASTDLSSDNEENDPSYRIGNIKSARVRPLSVKPNDPIQVAYTQMMIRNFSQLPVMTSERDLKGIISWKTVGSRIASGRTGIEVRHFMDAADEISISSSLFDGIRIVAEKDYVLVRDDDQRVSGIVTASDISVQFAEISAPFLQIGEIENNLRSLIELKNISIDQIKKTCDPDHLPKDFSSVFDLTFGNCVKILENEDNWQLLGIQMDRRTFIGVLDEVNRIRNGVMHFNPEPLQETDRKTLEEVGNTLKKMREIGAFHS